MSDPLISFCLVTKNHPEDLKYAIDKLFEHIGDIPFEVLIGDASDTPYVDARCTVFHWDLNKNGNARAFNELAKHAKGKYLTPFADDLECFPKCYERALKIMETEPLECIGLFFVKRVDLGHVCQMNFLTLSNFIMRKEEWDRLGGFDWEVFPHHHSDYDLMQRVVRQRHKLLSLPGCCLIHKRSTVAPGQNAEAAKRLTEKYPEGMVGHVNDFNLNTHVLCPSDHEHDQYIVNQGITFEDRNGQALMFEHGELVKT